MLSFSLLRVNGAAKFEVERVDLNIWVLPAILGRDVVFCDIGVLCELGEEFRKETVEFELRLPFRADSSVAIDLIPKLRADEPLCAMVFGTSDLKKNVDQDGTWLTDDRGRLLLTSLEGGKAEVVVLSSGNASALRVSTARLSFPPGTRLYLRMRVVTHTPNRLWAWQKSVRRRSHAVCDVRFNEFRESGVDIDVDMSKVLNPRRVNGYVIVSAAFRAGRVSPVPRYVRVLENDSWSKYLGRKLSRKGELFVITSWSDVNIAPSHPYRAFIELERRVSSPVKVILLSAMAIVASLLLSMPMSTIDQSPIAGFVRLVWDNLRTPLVGGISGTVLFGLLRHVVRLVDSRNLKRLRCILQWVESRCYRAK